MLKSHVLYKCEKQKILNTNLLHKLPFAIFYYLYIVKLKFVYMWEEDEIYLNREHGDGGDLHVMTELEIIEKGNSLAHAYIAIGLKAHISYWSSR